MSNPLDPLSNQANEPQTPSRNKNSKRSGAFVAVAAVVLLSLLVELVGGRGIGLGAGLVAVPVVSFACIILGSILSVSERTRRFAVGFLITGAIVLFVSAGVCVVLVTLISSSF